MRAAGRAADAITMRTLLGLIAPSLAALDDGAAAIGLRPALVGFDTQAPDFPRETAARINARGAVPVIAWTPTAAALDRWAAGIADYRRPVLLRAAAPDDVRAQFPRNAIWIRSPGEATAVSETLEWDGVRAVMFRLPVDREAVLAERWLEGGDLAAVEHAVTGA